MKQQYRIRNWPEYNAGLVKRGSLTFWVSEDVIEAWVSRDFTGDPGSPLLYSDIAIETVGHVLNLWIRLLKTVVLIESSRLQQQI